MSENTTDQPITDETAAGIGAGPEGGPIAGDPSSEPVATAAQSWGTGRTGPPSIAQDSDATWHTPEGVAQLDPGAILSAETVVEGGKIAIPQVDPASFGAGPYGGDTPAPEAPNTVNATTPGTEKVTQDELPFGVPTVSDESDKGGPISIPATAKGDAAPTGEGESSETGATETGAPGTTSADAPTSPGTASESGTTAAAPTGPSEPVGVASPSEPEPGTPASAADAPTGEPGAATTGTTTTAAPTAPAEAPAAPTGPATTTPTSTTE